MQEEEKGNESGSPDGGYDQVQQRVQRFGERWYEHEKTDRHRKSEKTLFLLEYLKSNPQTVAIRKRPAQKVQQLRKLCSEFIFVVFLFYVYRCRLTSILIRQLCRIVSLPLYVDAILFTCSSVHLFFVLLLIVLSALVNNQKQIEDDMDASRVSNCFLSFSRA